MLETLHFNVRDLNQSASIAISGRSLPISSLRERMEHALIISASSLFLNDLEARKELVTLLTIGLVAWLPET